VVRATDPLGERPLRMRGQTRIMGAPKDRRLILRLTIPAQWGAANPDRALQPVRLVDLSARGARIEHPAPLNEGLLCFVDLPRALGRGTLTGRVVWTSLHRDEQTREGPRQRYYRSGLAWSGLTPGQEDALATALAILTTAQAAGPGAPGTGTPREATAPGGEERTEGA
jgi:hypothetical protein